MGASRRPNRRQATDHVAAFLAVAGVVIVTPGPDTALTIRNSLLGGSRAGGFTAVGVCAGQLTWAVAASAGLAALVQAWSPVLVVARLVGAAYLTVLGCQALLAAASGSSGSGISGPVAYVLGLKPTTALRQGLISNLTNPKMPVFFASLLPQFMSVGAAPFGAMFPLGVLFAAMTFAWLSTYVWAVSRFGDVLRRPRMRHGLETVTGSALVVLGAGIALGVE